MLSVKLLPSNGEILKLEYLEAEEFQEVLVVCPSPQKADGVRLHLQNEGHKVNVITISKFIGDSVSLLEEKAPKIARKSEILLGLSTIWKIKFPEFPYAIFIKAFNLFTELRGFTLNLEMLEDVLVEEDEVLATAVRFFWLVSDDLELYDEHYTYNFLSEEFRSTESPVHDSIKNKVIVFMGFKHLSGGQLDLLKAIGIRAEVIIPIHEELFKYAEKNSWVGWLDISHDVVSTDLEPIEINVHRYKRGRFSEEANHKLNSLVKEGAEIFIPTETQEFKNINNLPINNLFYKISAHPFKPVLTLLTNEFKVRTDFGKKKMSLGEVKDSLENIEAMSNTRDFYFRWLKVKSLFLKLLEEWQNLSDANLELTFFDTEVFFEILNLDLPRNYFIPLFESSPSVFINSLDSAELSKATKGVLIGGSFLGPLKGGDSNFSDIQLGSLSSIGPIRSNELDFVAKKIALNDLAESMDLEIFLEEELEDVDISWLEIFEGFHLNNYSLGSEALIKKNILESKTLIQAPPIEKLSATSLQSYMDCPRKYYYKYIENLNVDPKLVESILPFQLGVIEHEVIGQFFKDESQSLEKLAVSELNKLLAKESMQISSVDYQEALFEIILLAKRGIKFVEGVRNYFGEGEMVFEKSIHDQSESVFHRGSIDFYYKTAEYKLVIDFKRSASGIPKAGDLQNFKKIQTWYYLNHIETDESQVGLFGYFNLSDPSASLLYAPTKEIQKSIKGSFSDINVKISFLANVDSLLEEYKEKEAALVSCLKDEQDFKPIPLDKKACLYCPVAYVCERGKE